MRIFCRNDSFLSRSFNNYYVPLWFPKCVLKATGPLLSIIIWGRVSEPTIVHTQVTWEVHIGHCANRCQLRALGRVQQRYCTGPRRGLRIMHSHRSPPVRAGRANPQHLELRWPRVRPGAKRSEAGMRYMIGLQRTARAMLRVHGCACSSSHAAHSERPEDMHMSCRDEGVDKCDSVDLLCATRSRSNLQAVATGRRFEVSSSNL